MKQFKVASGKIKDCVLDENNNYVTLNKGWFVAQSNEAGEVLSLGNGCSVVEESTESI